MQVNRYGEFKWLAAQVNGSRPFPISWADRVVYIGYGQIARESQQPAALLSPAWDCKQETVR